MTFADLLQGDSLFIDANTLVYHFEPHPTWGSACTGLLARIEQQKLIGFSSTHILTEAVHRLMMVEASRLPGWGHGERQEALAAAAGDRATADAFPHRR